MSNHDRLEGIGRYSHYALDAVVDRVFPAGDAEYAIDDVLSLESSLKAPASGTPPNAVAYNTLFALYEFTNTTKKYLQSAVQLPHSYVPGSPLSWHVHFIPEGAVGNGETVKFWVEIVKAPVFGVFNTSVETYASEYTAPVAGAPAHSHLMTAGATIDGTGLGGSSFILARIFRSEIDTYAGGVLLLGSDYHIEKNRLGSETGDPNT